MSSQRLNLPHGFSIRGAAPARIVISQAAASFPRPDPAAPSSSSSSSLVARNSDGRPQAEKRKLHGWPLTTDTKRKKTNHYFSPVFQDSSNYEVMDFLAACAEAMGQGNYEAVGFLLARLGQLSSPAGSPAQRVAARFTEALARRAAKLWPGIFSFSRPPMQSDPEAGRRALNAATPVLKFIHYTVNEKILRAVNGRDRVHIIDFDVGDGVQWAGLLQSLSGRRRPPALVRLTGVGRSKAELRATGGRLAALAAGLGLPFEFHGVAAGLEDVRLWMLHVNEEDTVAVNCVLQLHRLLHDGGMALAGFLGLVKSVKPEIVVVAEHEAVSNGPVWEGRFAGALLRYSAVFDMVDASMPLESRARTAVEEMFSEEIKDVVSEEGEERRERHEPFVMWRRRMGESGFRCAGMGERERRLGEMLLRMFGGLRGFSMEMQGPDRAGLTLRWRDQPLYTVSAWEAR